MEFEMEDRASSFRALRKDVKFRKLAKVEDEPEVMDESKGGRTLYDVDEDDKISIPTNDSGKSGISFFVDCLFQQFDRSFMLTYTGTAFLLGFQQITQHDSAVFARAPSLNQFLLKKLHTRVVDDENQIEHGSVMDELHVINALPLLLSVFFAAFMDSLPLNRRDSKGRTSKRGYFLLSATTYCVLQLFISVILSCNLLDASEAGHHYMT